jgi:putative hydrolase of the HAD superfamily
MVRFRSYDTLHSFRAASTAVVKAALQVTHDLSGHAPEELGSEYKHILIQGMALAFLDGNTSYPYREDRFRQLKAGVSGLLKTLTRHEHKNAVITEGPQDAQERTIETLGIAPYVNCLARTKRLGRNVRQTACEGAQASELAPKDTIMTGDSWERNIVPAAQAGMCCIFYSEVDRTLDCPNQQRWIEKFEVFQLLFECAQHGRDHRRLPLLLDCPHLR